jgi:CheY-like chemotaxis protein
MMLTSDDQLGDIKRCQELGLAAYLIKPITQSELLDAIMSVLNVPSLPDAPPLVTRRSVRQSERPLHILLAEDNLVNKRLAAGLLQRWGHRVITVSDGRAALAALERQRFDLVLLDVQMPEMDGFEVTAAIREKEKKSGGRIPIIAVTAHAMKGDRERCLEAGMDDYVSKPIEPQQLFDAIERLAPPAGVEASAPEEQPAEEILDRDAALARVDGDEELLKDLVVLFLDDCPKLLSEIRVALARCDSTALTRAAHRLKGTVGNFTASAAFEAARRLEMIGRQGDLTGAEKAFAALEEEIERLKLALAALAKEDVACRN